MLEYIYRKARTYFAENFWENLIVFPLTPAEKMKKLLLGRYGALIWYTQLTEGRWGVMVSELKEERHMGSWEQRICQRKGVANE